MRKPALLLVIGGIVVVGAWAFYFLAWRASRGGEATPLYSARRYDPYGTAALRELLLERGIEVKTLQRPRLKKTDAGVLVQALPLGDAPSQCGSCRCSPSYRVHNDSLEEWVAAGNRVVQFSRGQTDLMRSLGVSVEGEYLADAIEKHQRKGGFPDKLPGRTFQVNWRRNARGRDRSDLSTRKPLTLRSPSTFTVEKGSRLRPLLMEGSRAVAAEIKRGAGRIILIGAPTPVLNGDIEKGGNLEFVLDLVGEGPVILDEWSHGIGHGGTIIGLIREFGLAPILFQILFVVGLYVWSTRGHRRHDKESVPRRRSSTEQIATLGRLYSQALSREETAKRVRFEALRRIAGALGCTLSNLESGRFRARSERAQEAREILEAIRQSNPQRHPKRLNVHLAGILTLTHEFAKENGNDRRTV